MHNIAYSIYIEYAEQRFKILYPSLGQFPIYLIHPLDWCWIWPQKGNE